MSSRKQTPAFHHHHHSTGPMQINLNSTANSSKSLQQQMYQRQLDCTPTFIEVGAGSFQEGMPIMCGGNGGGGESPRSNATATVSCTGINSGSSSAVASKSSFAEHLIGDNLIESLADAMNETASSSSSHHHHHNHYQSGSNNYYYKQRTNDGPLKYASKSPAIAISQNNPPILINPNPDKSSVSQEVLSFKPLLFIFEKFLFLCVFKGRQ